MDRDQFRELVLARRASLLETAKYAGDADPGMELDQTRVGRLSRMDAMQIQEMNLETERRRQRELRLLDAALERLDQGEYGECFECGEAIHPGRLQADLTATLCIRCASRAEARSETQA